MAHWHLKINSNDKYCDLVVKKNDQVIFFELLATPMKGQLNEHYDHVPIYAEHLSATETWIINFTCKDDVKLYPHWPLDNVLEGGVQVVFFKHKPNNFTNVQMVSCSWDMMMGKRYVTSIKEICTCKLI
jgi:hypothetical protein